jgi:uncharacterized membrane protein YedE/YeeE
MLHDFTPLASLAGGALIGLAAVLLMAFHGRVAGLTGILAGVLPPMATDWPWRAAFLAGAILAAPIYIALGGHVEFNVPVGPVSLVVGGLIVGVGVVIGGGCTSGHGVCGMARLSKRSAVATLVFMTAAFVTVFIIRHIF